MKLERTFFNNKEKKLFAFQFVILLMLCFLHGLGAGHNCNFWPINGTFQNFNPVRRLLSGQIPYKDFSDYLGLGHLYLGSIFTFLFGGTYRSSLIAFSFLTFLSLAFVSFFIGTAILKNKNSALAFTNLLLSLLLVQPLFYKNGFPFGENFRNALNSSLNVGNSARFVRAFILPVFIFLILILEKHFEIIAKKISFIKNKEMLFAFFFGLASGGAFLWSNDFGISCWLCSQIIFLWCVFSRTRKVKESLFIFLISLATSLVGIFILGEIFTLGHFFGWASATFGTGGYQKWYYGGGASSYLFEIDFSFLTLLQLFLAVYYFALLFKNNASGFAAKRFGIPAFANLACYCAANEYKLLSGGYLHEVAYSVLCLTIFFELVDFLARNSLRKKSGFVSICSVLISISLVINSSINEAVTYKYLAKEIGIAGKLGGGVCTLSNDLNSAHEFLKGKKIFSTYASAQEVVENQFQPSGTDYIIHVLGDKQRAKYLNDFRKNNFDYAVTIRSDFTPWENWVERANWFFYRELYKNYHPVFQNNYERYWQRNSPAENNCIKTSDLDFSISTEQINEQTVKLIISTNSGISGKADVLVDYEVLKNPKSRKAFLCFNPHLHITDSNIPKPTDVPENVNSLRKASKEFVPITIKSGRGEIVLTSIPVQSTVLNLKSFSCDEIFLEENIK